MALNLPERKCECGCGQFFKPKRQGQRFVDYKHRALWHKHHRQCPHCGHWLDEPVGQPGCQGCPFFKSVAGKRGKILPDRSGRCTSPGGFCGVELKQAG